MISSFHAALIGLMCAGVFTIGVLLLLGLCRAAADVPDVVEDAGEYDN